MSQKVLGKITSVEWGTIKDHSFLCGLILEFHLEDETSVGSGSKYTINFSSSCKWTTEERQRAITKLMDQIYQLLKDAKCNYISELINKPVQVTIENNMFQSFRILKEVL